MAYNNFGDSQLNKFLRATLGEPKVAKPHRNSQPPRYVVPANFGFFWILGPQKADGITLYLELLGNEMAYEKQHECWFSLNYHRDTCFCFPLRRRRNHWQP